MSFEKLGYRLLYKHHLVINLIKFSYSAGKISPLIKVQA